MNTISNRYFQKPHIYVRGLSGMCLMTQYKYQGDKKMQELKPIKEGKVREIYDNGDSLIMVATDRISCFDVILDNVISKKGTVLTQMSKFWFDMTQDILPNHMISVDVKDMPEFFQQEKFDGNSVMCRKLEMLPIECIVRGYITGSGWASYKENGTVCGIKLPEGLKESDKLPEPIYTHQQRPRLAITMRIYHMSRVLLTLRSTSQERARSTLQSSRSTRSHSTRSVQSMHLQEESLLQIQSLSLALMRTAISFSVMRCSHRTAQDSGRQMYMSQDMVSHHLTSSSHVIG